LIDNGANVNLVAGGNVESGGGTATSTGTYNGLLVYQPASNTTAMTVAGGSTAYLNGSLYAPSAQVTLNNGTGTKVSGGIVASTLNMSGGATFNATAGTKEGSLIMSSPKLVQ
jgi:hypothetical protein